MSPDGIKTIVSQNSVPCRVFRIITVEVTVQYPSSSEA